MICCTEVLEPLSQILLAAVLFCHDGLVNITWDCWGRKMWQGQSTWCMPRLSVFIPSGAEMCSTSLKGEQVWLFLSSAASREAPRW